MLEAIAGGVVAGIFTLAAVVLAHWLRERGQGDDDRQAFEIGRDATLPLHAEPKPRNS